MTAVMKGGSLILPGSGALVKILPQQQQQQAPALSYHCQPCLCARQHSSHTIRHQRQQVLLLDKKNRNGSFCVRRFPSSFRGDARAQGQQRPWLKDIEVFILSSVREPKRTVDVQSCNRPCDECNRPPGNYPSPVTQLLTALERQFPSQASVKQSSKTRDLNAPGIVHRSTSLSTLEVVQFGSRASSKLVPIVSPISGHSRSRRAEKCTSDLLASSSNDGRPGSRSETSYVAGKQRLPRSSNRIASTNSDLNYIEQIEPGVGSQNVSQKVLRSEEQLRRPLWSDGRSTPAVRLQSDASNGSRDRDTAQGNTLHSAGTTSEAVAFLKNCLQRGITVESYVYGDVLTRCSKHKDLLMAKQVHDCMIRSGMDKNPYLASSLVNVYIQCGELLDARRVFDELEKKTVITWNTMIAGYARSDDAESARKLFTLMRQDGERPDKVTYLCILKACASPLALTWGKEVHECIRHAGFESDVRVGTALLKMYAKCGCITEARRIFEDLPNRDVITWNIMIGAYSGCGRGVEAYELFLQMRQEGFEPDAFTYISILNASASVGALQWVKEVHGHASQAGLESNVRVGTALVHMYAESGSLDDARRVFDRMEKRDVVTWNAMIGGLAQHGCGHEAYRLFLQMRREGFRPNAITYMSILNASESAGAMELGKEIHGHASKAGLESDLRVGTALVHMYAESGSIDDARRVFDRMEKRDVFTWTTMIGGLAHHGCGHEALELFRNMNAELVTPNATTFVAVLTACCHGGLLDDGRRLFFDMKQNYGIEPETVHYTCMVDLLGRAGHLEEAMRFIRDMPVEPSAVTWTALLGACRTYANVELGELAAEELFKLEPNNAAAYVLLSNIYGAAGKWEKVSLVRSLMRKRGVRKDPGRSWIEVDKKIHEFVAGDTSHPEAKAIYTELNKLTERVKAEGYIPDTRLVLHDINEEEKELALCSHSEKLAIAYGLLHTLRGEPIRVRKNLRVCPDCHTATKLISKVTGREIIARDANRFHHFKNGVCSCGNYW